jgi:hypothetical protein
MRPFLLELGPCCAASVSRSIERQLQAAEDVEDGDEAGCTSGRELTLSPQ